MDRGAWWATVHGVARVRPDLVTKQQHATRCKGGRILSQELDIAFDDSLRQDSGLRC